MHEHARRGRERAGATRETEPRGARDLMEEGVLGMARGELDRGREWTRRVAPRWPLAHPPRALSDERLSLSPLSEAEVIGAGSLVGLLRQSDERFHTAALCRSRSTAELRDTVVW